MKENIQIIFIHTAKNHNIQDDILLSKLNSKLWKNQICNCKRLTLIFIYEKNIIFNYLHTYVLYGNMIKYWQNSLLINEKFQIEN